MANKYTYYKIIQTNGGYGWDDDDYHETGADFIPLNNKLFKENLKAYRDNFAGPIRVIKRRELNEGDKNADHN